jgi:hypothetical protein
MVSPLYDVTGGHPLLGGKFLALKDDATLPGSGFTAAEKKAAYNIFAEQALRLKGPVFTGDAADRIKYAVVRQINVLMNEGIEPLVLKSVSNTNPGNTTQYRDRYVDPLAAQIVEDETGVRAVRYVPKVRGV